MWSCFFLIIFAGFCKTELSIKAWLYARPICSILLLTAERPPYSSGSLIWDKHPHSQQGLVSSDTVPRSCCEIVQKEVDLKSRNGVSQVQGCLERCLCLLQAAASPPLCPSCSMPARWLQPHSLALPSAGVCVFSACGNSGVLRDFCHREARELELSQAAVSEKVNQG